MLSQQRAELKSLNLYKNRGILKDQRMRKIHQGKVLPIRAELHVSVVLVNTTIIE